MKYPKVSIILLNMNQPALTLACIKSLKQTTYPNKEIIVVDQNSRDNSLELLMPIDGIKLIPSKINLGFTGGNNLGMRAATGEYFLLLNNDTEVKEDFLEHLVIELQINPSVGAASPLIRFFHNPEYVQYAGGPDEIDLVSGRNSWRGWNSDVSFTGAERTTAGHGAAFIIKQSVAEQIGLLDDNFFIYYEELDWSLRIRKAGFNILFVPNSEVYHKESMTMPKEHPFRVRMMARNRILLSRKHLTTLGFFLSLLYIVFLSFPVNTFRYIVKKKIDLLKAYLTGSMQGIFNRPYTILN